MKLKDYMTKVWGISEQYSEIHKNPQYSLEVFSLGLVGEIGEVAELIKKSLRDGNPLDYKALALELGDCLCYHILLLKWMEINYPERVQEQIQSIKEVELSTFPEGKIFIEDPTKLAIILGSESSYLAHHCVCSFSGVNFVDLVSQVFRGVEVLGKLAQTFKLDLEDIALGNIQKLEKRASEGKLKHQDRIS